MNKELGRPVLGTPHLSPLLREELLTSGTLNETENAGLLLSTAIENLC